jgi:hypothetical protein
MYLRLTMNYQPRAEIHCSLLILTVGRLHEHNTEDLYSPRLTVDVRRVDSEMEPRELQSASHPRLARVPR